ncbi:hypothetical protein ACFW9D_05570 [Streptomyces sp. NPDC059524]|uniref:hypothetical protein n=1 Tax=Streptomyces sp. NPDC059524 TaxID=3346856 RepID=UPI0036CD010C
MTEAPTEPQARGVHIDAQPGRATITIDGTPLTAVTGYVLEHSVSDSLPTLIVHTRQPDDTVFDGLARVAVGIPQTPGQIVREFLAGVDPKLLDQEALNRADYGGEGATARAMLATLTEWAHGGGDA